MAGLSRKQMAWRVAHDIEEGECVNLGVGLPLDVLSYAPDDREIIFHSENGILGMEVQGEGDEPDPNLVNAGKRPVNMLPGGSFFNHAESFAMIRGGHIDICVLGAYQVSEKGDLANWMLPGSPIGRVGGAMDLAYGAKRLFVICEHNSKDGTPKIVGQCTMPLTGLACVDRIFTDLAIIDVTEDGLVVREMVEGLAFDELCGRTAAPLTLANDWQPLTAPEI